MTYPASVRAADQPLPPPPAEAATDGSASPPDPTAEAPAPTAPASAVPPPPEPQAAPTSGGGRQLLLPDISVIGTFLGHASNDKRDQDRDKLKLDSVELSLQSYVYPGIKGNAFIVFDGGGANVEEGYLNIENLGVKKASLSATVGRRKVPFGRVNQLHSHSWLYAVAPAVLRNLVAPESLNGDGAYVSYLLPTGRLFTQLDAGFWTTTETPEFPTISLATDVPSSPGSGLNGNFQTARLWTASSALGGDFELGGSLAVGRAGAYDLGGGTMASPKVTLSGLDLTYRREGVGVSRLLLRSEYIRHRQSDSLVNHTVDGWYAMIDQRVDANQSYGARYDWSEYPYAPGLHESSVSLIATHSLTEQTYLRGQLIHGDRPGKKNYSEAWFEWVWGFGPHTHNLE